MCNHKVKRLKQHSVITGSFAQYPEFALHENVFTLHARYASHTKVRIENFMATKQQHFWSDKEVNLNFTPKKD